MRHISQGIFISASKLKARSSSTLQTTSLQAYSKSAPSRPFHNGYRSRHLFANISAPGLPISIHTGSTASSTICRKMAEAMSGLTAFPICLFCCFVSAELTDNSSAESADKLSENH